MFFKKKGKFCYLQKTLTYTYNLVKNSSNKFYKNLILAYYNGKLVINIIVLYYMDYHLN